MNICWLAIITLNILYTPNSDDVLEKAKRSTAKACCGPLLGLPLHAFLASADPSASTWSVNLSRNRRRRKPKSTVVGCSGCQDNPYSKPYIPTYLPDQVDYSIYTCQRHCRHTPSILITTCQSCHFWFCSLNPLIIVDPGGGASIGTYLYLILPRCRPSEPPLAARKCEEPHSIRASLDLRQQASFTNPSQPPPLIVNTHNSRKGPNCPR